MGAFEKDALPGLADAIADRAAYFCHQREHAAQHFPQRGQVVLRNPGRQLHQLGVENRHLVKYRFNQPCFDRRSLIVQAGDHTDQLFLAKGHHDAAPDWGVILGLELVGKGPIKRHRKHNVTECGHQRDGTDNPSSAMASFRSCQASFFCRGSRSKKAG